MALWSRLTVGLGADHLGDDELLELLNTGSQPSSAATHLSQCEVCAKRSTKLQNFLSGLAETNEAAQTRTFPLDRLSTQRERIMRRLRRSVEPARRGRVLSFPALVRPVLAGVHRTSRWLGAAAAAGLVVGITVGQFLHVHPELGGLAEQAEMQQAQQAQQTQQTMTTSIDAPAMASSAALERPSTASFTEPAAEYDDPFLDELELMLSSPQVAELSPLDEITPRIREVAVNLW